MYCIDCHVRHLLTRQNWENIFFFYKTTEPQKLRVFLSSVPLESKESLLHQLSVFVCVRL